MIYILDSPFIMFLCSYQYFLFISNLWTCISTHMQMTIPGLVILIQLTRFRACWSWISMLFLKFTLSSRTNMTFRSPKYPLGFHCIGKPTWCHSLNLLKFLLPKFSFLFTFFLTRFTHFSEHDYKAVNTSRKLRTIYDAIQWILVL